MLLHTLNASPASAAFRDCIRVAGARDAVLLTGDGVYAAVASTAACEELLACGAELFILQPDAAAAGVTAIAPSIQAVDIAGFVALTVRFARQQAWY